MRLRRNVHNVAATYIPSPAASVDRESANRYLDVISALLRSRWNQPSAVELGRRRPVVGVKLEIARDGRLLAKQIGRRSGNAAMDASIETLLNGLTTVPPPTNYGVNAATFSVDIAFEID